LKLYTSTPDPRISEISEIVVKDSQRAPEGQLSHVEGKHLALTNKIPITHQENSLPKKQLQDSAWRRSKQISSPFLTYVNLCKPLLQAEQPDLNLIQQIEELAARSVTFFSSFLFIFQETSIVH